MLLIRFRKSGVKYDIHWPEKNDKIKGTCQNFREHRRWPYTTHKIKSEINKVKSFQVKNLI